MIVDVCSIQDQMNFDEQIVEQVIYRIPLLVLMMIFLQYYLFLV
jgi:hypothetical protein